MTHGMTQMEQNRDTVLGKPILKNAEGFKSRWEKKHVTLIKVLQTTHNHSGSWTALCVWEEMGV